MRECFRLALCLGGSVILIYAILHAYTGLQVVPIPMGP